MKRQQAAISRPVALSFCALSAEHHGIAARNAHHRTRFKQRTTQTERNRVAHVRGTIAWAIVAQRVNAFVRRLDTHAVRQHRKRREEVSTRNKRLDARLNEWP